MKIVEIESEIEDGSRPVVAKQTKRPKMGGPANYDAQFRALAGQVNEMTDTLTNCAATLDETVRVNSIATSHGLNPANVAELMSSLVSFRDGCIVNHGRIFSPEQITKRADLVLTGQLSREVEALMEKTHIAFEAGIVAANEAIERATREPMPEPRHAHRATEQRAHAHIRAGREERWTFKASRQIPMQRDNAGRQTDLRVIKCNHRWVGEGASATAAYDVLIDGVRVADSNGRDGDWRWIDRDAERLFNSAANANKMIGITEIVPHDLGVAPSEPLSGGNLLMAVLGGIALVALAIFGSLHKAHSAEAEVYYANCAAARAAGAAPIMAGEPGYRPGLDRDHDGVACE